MRKWWNKITAAMLALAVIFGGGALAQQLFPRDITLTWTNPTQYEDGSLIEAGDLTDIRVVCYRNNNTVPIIDVTVPAAGEGLLQTETLSVIPQPGTYICEVYARIFDGTESVASNQSLPKKYTGRPKAATGLGAQ